MKVRLNDRILARELRAQGFSLREIMSKIPNLSKGTLNGWLKDIELTPEQKTRLLTKIRLGAEKGRQKGSFTNHQKRIERTKLIIDNAKNEVRKNFPDPLFLSGIMLYWAEGDKTQERIGFANSDPVMIEFMMKWFRKVCCVEETKFRVALSIMTLHNKDASEKFWSDVTQIPLKMFNKTRVKPTTLKGKRNPSYMGTCRIIVSDKDLFRRIAGWRLGIIDNFNSLPS